MRLIFLFSLLFFQKLFASYITEDEAALFHEQGYLIKRCALSSDELQEMNVKSSSLMDRVLEEISSDTYPYLSIDQKIYVDGSQIVFTKSYEKGAAIKRIVGCGSIEPAFHKVLCAEKMRETFFNLLGSSRIEQLICQFHPKMPGDGVSFVKHRDLRYRMSFDPDWEDVGGNGSYAICIIAIDPMSLKNGGLVIDTKSYPPGKREGSEEVSLSLDPGDMLFMHPELLHWSGPNHSSYRRRALLAGYCIYGANHKNYPGDCTNDVFSRKEDELEVQPAPWKKVGDTNF